jgi:CubicO group peptidase (beta-lactamase class C family)
LTPPCSGARWHNESMPGPGFAKDRLRRMKDVGRQHVDDGVAPGFVSAIQRRGEVVVDVVGQSAFERPSPMREDSLFRIASMTKPVTAVLTLILVEECVLRLDDPVTKILPELADRRVLRRLDGPLDDTVPAARDITVRDLLTFTMGFGAYFGDAPIVERAAALELAPGPPHPQAPPPPDEFIARLGTLPLMAHPGDRWLYHTGADVLGVLLERASGSSFDALLRDRVLGPLGMKDTGFHVPARDIHRLVTSYTTHSATGELTVFDEPGGEWSTPPAFCSGGAGLVSTVSDYLAFAQMLLRGGSPLLARTSVAAMTTNQLTDAQRAVSGFYPGDFDARGWGFGVQVVTRLEQPAAPVGQYGWNGGLGTAWCNDPSEQMICILLTNAAFTSPRLPPIVADFLTGAYAAIAD